jgi:hypothetical protein
MTQELLRELSRLLAPTPFLLTLIGVGRCWHNQAVLEVVNSSADGM